MNIYPLSWTIPLFGGRSVDITGYGIMMMVGFLIGGWLITLELRRRGLYEEYAADMTVAAVVGGVLGAKLWYWVLHPESSLFSRGGLVWYGGFVGGFLAVVLNGLRLKVPTRWTAHLAAPALAAAYALGRIGCFIVNDDYGRPSTLPWAVRFPQGLPPSTAANMQQQFGVPIPQGVDPATVLAVHPTQLYEVILMLGAFALLWQLRLRARPIGWIFGIYLLCAGAERFIIEIFRAKDDRFFGPLTIAQVMSLVLITAGAILMTRLRHGAEVAPGEYLSRSNLHSPGKA